MRGILLLGALVGHLACQDATAFIRVTDVTDETGGRVLLCRPFPADGVVLVFTHSMYGGDVRERFVAAGDTLRRVEMTTENAAAADYYAYTAAVVLVDGWYQVDVAPADYAEVVVRVAEVGGQRLTMGSETVDLLALAGAGHRLRLDVVRQDDRTPSRAC